MSAEKLKKIREEFIKEIEEVNNLDTLEKLRIKYLGRKSKFNEILSGLKDLSVEQRKDIGARANQLRKEMEDLLKEKDEDLHYRKSLLEPVLDITKPGKKIEAGHLHILTKVEEEIKQIFLSMNFSVAEGPEVENEYYNFDALNIPKNHPARDMWDTFWLKQQNRQNRLLLRTHTSPVQIRYMEKHQPPFQIIAPGRVFRYEATDASHEINFGQLEGLMIGKDVCLANFKFVVEEFFRKFFKGQKVEFRFIPSYYPFVEPGLDVAIKIGTRSKGQETKGGERWMEVAGAGMVHRNVLKAVGYNPDEWQGFAFGFGPDRLAMIKYGIPDIRLFYSGDLRFIKQF